VIWSRILAVPSPGAGNIPSLLSYISSVEPSSRAKAAARRKRYKIAAVVVGAIVAFGFVVFSSDGFAYMYFLGMGVLLLKKFFDSDAPDEFGRAARAAEASLRNLQYSWQREASGEEFYAELDRLRTLTEEYRKLPEQRKQKVRELERALYEIQLRRYLEQFDIASADIPHIKRRAKSDALCIRDRGRCGRRAVSPRNRSRLRAFPDHTAHHLAAIFGDHI